MSEPNYAAEMKLPEGKTCADCNNGRVCNALFGAVRRRFTSCDFYPSRFTEYAEGAERFVPATQRAALQRAKEGA